MVHIDFYFDIVCPYAYIASTQIEEICNSTNSTVTWKPVLLGGLYELSKAPQGKNNSATTVMAPKKRIYFGRETVMQVARYNVTLNSPSKYPISTLNCMRFLTFIKDDSLRVQFARALYYYFWVETLRLDDPNILANCILAQLNKIRNLNNDSIRNDPNLRNINTISDIKAVFDSNESIKEELKENTKNACFNYGMFGVPTFIVKTKKGEEMFWGVDRIPFLKAFCLAKNNDVLFPPTDLMPKIRNQIISGGMSYVNKIREKNTIEFYFDFASPWAFLAYSRLKEFDVFAKNIVLKPVLLGAIFKAVGTHNTPMATVGPVKRKYMAKDIEKWVKAIGVNLKFTDFFPIRTITPLRVFIVDNSTIDCIYKAAWQQNINISDDNELCKVLDRSGFNGKELLAATKDASIKNILKENTAFAIEKGMFGVPAYVVNKDYDRFVWGQEKMDFVKEMCHGWVAPTKSSIFEKKPPAKL